MFNASAKLAPIAIAVAILFSPASCALFAQDALRHPVIFEDYDELWLVDVATSPHGYERVIFVRGGQVFARRWRLESMVWDVQGDRFFLTWNDWVGVKYQVPRVVSAKRLYTFTLDEWHDPDKGPFWCMGWNRRDLKQP